MEEIKLNMENLSKEEREQLLKLVEKANKKERKIWVPDLEENFYYIIGDGSIASSWWSNDNCDLGAYQIGNCFKTKEEAEFAVEKQKVIIELERFAKEHNNTNLPINVYLYCYNDLEDNKSITSRYEVSAVRASNLGTVSFSDITTAKNAIQTIGKDRLIKYYFGIKE